MRTSYLKLAIVFFLCGCDPTDQSSSGELAELRTQLASMRQELDTAKEQLRAVPPQAERDFLRELQKIAKFNENGDLVFEGTNVLIQSGSGSTEGEPNGKGNLIIGYNEAGEGTAKERSGSHNLVVGVEQEYTSFGGVLFGSYNTLRESYGTILGGFHNAILDEPKEASLIASGSTIVGGNSNSVSGAKAVIVGGSGNEARSYLSVVIGGSGNVASDSWSVVTGGNKNGSQGQLSVYP